MADLSNVRVNGQRLWDALMEMAKIGATPKGGCKRLTLTDLDKQGRELFRAWCEKEGCTVEVDEMGNMFATPRPASRTTSPPVLIGSHLDTQPTGGKFDGVLGVLGGLEVVRSLNDLKIKTRRPIVVANWTNEEGSRYAPAMVSSGVFAGVYTKEFAYSRLDADGKTLGDELDAHRLQGRQAHRRLADPRLVRAAYRAGADSRGREHRRRRRHPRPGPALVRDQAHRLREPRRLDADAAPQGRAARRGAHRRARQQDRPLARRRSPSPPVGMLNPYPNSRNVIPGEVFMTSEFRHPVDSTLTEMDAALKAGVEEIAKKIGLTYDLKQVFYYAPVEFDKGLRLGGAARRPSASATAIATSSPAPGMTLAISRASARPR